jgi:hypothetical protein
MRSDDTKRVQTGLSEEECERFRELASEYGLSLKEAGYEAVIGGWNDSTRPIRTTQRSPFSTNWSTSPFHHRRRRMLTRKAISLRSDMTAASRSCSSTNLDILPALKDGAFFSILRNHGPGTPPQLWL